LLCYDDLITVWRCHGPAFWAHASLSVCLQISWPRSAGSSSAFLSHQFSTGH
jgi:hypothetical protein